jgi:acetyl esterase/lipase
MFVHPELADVLASLPPRPENPYADIEATRAAFRDLMAGFPPRPDVTVEHRTVGRGIHVQVLRPLGSDGTLPGVLHVHGGGFSYGELNGPSRTTQDVCAEVGAVVVNVHYRLAPEHRFPAGLEDCYAALEWMTAQAGDLDLDAARIGVTGASAGGCLSAALCLLARDRQGPAIAFQCLLIPALDDRGSTASARSVTDRRIPNGTGVRLTWDAYLGPDRGDDVPAYAAPARAVDLSGLPAAYVLTCGLDPLRDEGLDYALRLARADVPVEVKHVPGAWHFFEAFAPHARLAGETTAHWINALRTALHR